MGELVTPDQAQLVYDPWVTQEVAGALSNMQALFAVITIFIAGIFLMQLYQMVKK